MQTAPLEFTKYGEHFRQIAREGRIAVYERKHGWEVVRIRTVKAGHFRGKPTPEREKYPASERWGIDGWTCTTKERAWQRMDQMLEEDRQGVQEAHYLQYQPEQFEAGNALEGKDTATT